jgi:hypothetical protein
MKNYLIILLLTFVYHGNLIAAEKKDCSQLKKWSAKITCKTKNLTSGVKNAGKSVLPEKLKTKKIKIIPDAASKKFKAFKEKKTMADWFKKKEK